MSRNQNGTYFLPDGNPVTPGELITADWANTTLDDVANALTDSLDRDGKGAMRAPLRNVDGGVTTPAVAFTNETGTGLYREAQGVMSAAIQGKRVAAFRAGGMDVDGTLSAAALGGAAADGAGASGKWNIAISGNAATASRLTGSWDAIPAGTRVPFAQAYAPTGWTQVTDDSANNRMLRVVSGTGGSTGGIHDPVINNLVPAHTHGFQTGYESENHSHNYSGSTAGQNVGHTHYFVTNYAGEHEHYLGLKDGGPPDGDAAYATTYYPHGAIVSYQNTDRQGSHVHDGNTGGTSTDHVHGFSGTTGGISTNHVHAGSTDNGSSQTNWTPRYIDMIICSKN